MLFINLVDIPEHLHDSELFKSFDGVDDSSIYESDSHEDETDNEDERDTIELPSTVMKLDTEVSNISHLKHLLETLRFWQSCIYPAEIINYCLSDAGSTQEIITMLETFTPQLSQFENLLTIVKSENRAVAAAELGDLQVLEWLHANPGGETNFWSAAVCAAAAKNGHIKCLGYLHDEVGCPWDEETCKSAFNNAHEPCLAYAIRNNCPMPSVMSIVEIRAELPFTGLLAYSGLIDCVAAVQDLHEYSPSALDLMKFAAMGGQVATMKYLVERRNCGWDESICIEAAKNDHLACLEYAHANGCPWTESTCASAAQFGNLACLRFAVENGCPCTVMTMEVAFWRGDVTIMQFLRNELFI